MTDLTEPERLRSLIRKFPQCAHKSDYEAWVANVGVFDAHGISPHEKEQLEAQIRSAMAILGTDVYSQEKPKHK